MTTELDYGDDVGGIGVAPNGDVYAPARRLGDGTQGIYKIDAITNNVSLVRAGNDESAVTVAANGDVIIFERHLNDEFGNPITPDAVIRISGVTGASTVLTTALEFDDDTGSIGVTSNGDIYVPGTRISDQVEGVFKIDGSTSAISLFLTGKDDACVAVAPNDDLIIFRDGINDENGNPIVPDNVVRINPNTGAITTLTEDLRYDDDIGGIGVSLNGDIYIPALRISNGTEGIFKISGQTNGLTLIRAGANNASVTVERNLGGDFTGDLRSMQPILLSGGRRLETTSTISAAPTVAETGSFAARTTAYGVQILAT